MNEECFEDFWNSEVNTSEDNNHDIIDMNWKKQMLKSSKTIEEYLEELKTHLGA